MKVLYVGQPSSARATVFATLLGEHFAAVVTASLADFGALDLTGVDVVVVDGELGSQPVPPEELVAADLPIPTVLVGVMGGIVSDRIGLKLGRTHGCPCLEHWAIVDDSALGYPINKPLRSGCRVPGPARRRPQRTAAPRPTRCTSRANSALLGWALWRPLRWRTSAARRSTW